jgi:hypothetical protein
MCFHKCRIGFAAAVLSIDNPILLPNYMLQHKRDRTLFVSVYKRNNSAKTLCIVHIAYSDMRKQAVEKELVKYFENDPKLNFACLDMDFPDYEMTVGSMIRSMD